jgi:four helix bundle protein
MNDSASLDLGTNPRQLLAHERLDAYQLAKQLDLLAVTVGKRVGRGNAWILDQLSRASGSTVLNIAEANGRSGDDRLQHFRIAKGSVLEVDSALDLRANRGLVRAEERARAHALAVRVAQCLSRLINR